jgi:hypothetical protein
MIMTAAYDVYRSRPIHAPRPADGVYYPNLLTEATRAEAERFAIEQSAADPDGRTYVITNSETWKIAAEYRRGELRLDRPHDRRALAA